ncbi:MAG: DUF389 domain-containing protein, partial [Bacteroidota bacterium]
MPETNQTTPPNKVEIKRWHQKSIGELFTDFGHFLEDLVDLKEGMDQAGTIQNISNNKRMKGANAYLLMCSIMVASLGLDLNSPAVIIGAMLISPLMSPILGVGLGVAINDRKTLAVSLQHFLVSVIIALITSYLYFSFTPFGEITDEISARTAPNLLDGMVAIFGGTAGIISTTRLDKSNAIPGVAIATALMPPVCVAGFGLANQEWDFFLKALYLFFLNSFFIALSTYLIIRLLGFRYKEFPNEMERRRNQFFVGIISIIILIPACMILWETYQKLREKTTIEEYIRTHFENDFTTISDWETTITDTLTQIDIQLIGQPIRQTKLDSCDLGLEKILGKKVKLTGYQSREIPFDEIQRLKNEVGGFQGKLDIKIANLEKIQQDRELEIEQLKRELDSLQNSVILADIFKETKINYPLLDEIGFAKDVQQTNFDQQQAIPVLLIKWNRKKPARTRPTDQVK